jgi:hypothetical protein
MPYNWVGMNLEFASLEKHVFCKERRVLAVVNVSHRKILRPKHKISSCPSTLIPNPSPWQGEGSLYHLRVWLEVLIHLLPAGEGGELASRMRLQASDSLPICVCHRAFSFLKVREPLAPDVNCKSNISPEKTSQ